MISASHPGMRGLWTHIPPPYSSHYLANPSPNGEVAYCVDAFGWVCVIGSLQNDGATGPFQILTGPICTLPVGVRPASQILFTLQTNNALTRIDISPLGVISVATVPASTATLSLQALWFQAAQ